MIELLKNKKFHMIYLRNDANEPYGLLLAYLDEQKNQVNFGWSRVGIDRHGKLKDRFDKNKAQTVAFHRAANCGLKSLPQDFKKILDTFFEDCKTYFVPRVPKFADQVSYKA